MVPGLTFLDRPRVISRAFILVFVALFLAVGGLELRDPSPLAATVTDGEDVDVDTLDHAVDDAPSGSADVVSPSGWRRSLTAPAVATSSHAAAPLANPAPPVL